MKSVSTASFFPAIFAITSLSLGCISTAQASPFLCQHKQSGVVRQRQACVRSERNIADIAALQGQNGATGATGSAGATGETGVQGLAGATGAIGATGMPGATGAPGPTGAQGAAGDDGTNLFSFSGLTGAANITNYRGYQPNGISAASNNSDYVAVPIGTSCSVVEYTFRVYPAPSGIAYWAFTLMKENAGTIGDTAADMGIEELCHISGSSKTCSGTKSVSFDSDYLVTVYIYSPSAPLPANAKAWWHVRCLAN